MKSPALLLFAGLLLTTISLPAATLSAPAPAASLLKPGDVLVIAGDSITQQKSYSVMIEDYLLMCQHVNAGQIVQDGWSGEQASGLLARLDTDFYPFQPTAVTLSYGMNDGHYQPLDAPTGDAFRKAETDLVESFKQHGIHAIVIGSPGVVDSYYFRDFKGDAPYDPAVPAMYNKTLGGLADIAREVAEKEGVSFADLHTVMMDIMTKMKAAKGDKYPFVNNGDGVHPSGVGCLVMAYAYLKGLGCDGNIGTITVDMFNGDAAATGSPGQTILSSKDGTIQIESTRYPFCIPAADTREVLPYLPFNQELNRYMLIVKGISGSGAKVTWGTVTKQFTKEQLAKGVNLAAEFLDNPFLDQWGKVDRMAQDQQEQDRALYQSYLHNTPALRATAATNPAVVDGLIKSGLTWSHALYSMAAASVIPVRHQIKVEVVP
jgi:lysophospholipase L1-like esterase